MRQYHLFAIIISLVSGIAGILISYYINVPTGPAIVILSGVFYFITFILKDKVKG